MSSCKKCKKLCINCKNYLEPTYAYGIEYTKASCKIVTHRDISCVDGEETVKVLSPEVANKNGNCKYYDEKISQTIAPLLRDLKLEYGTARGHRVINTLLSAVIKYVETDGKEVFKTRYWISKLIRSFIQEQGHNYGCDYCETECAAPLLPAPVPLSSAPNLVVLHRCIDS